jgi:NAD(P)-dependent dehydrogenase (short-subunit alcohol dehydrogenase family)
MSLSAAFTFAPVSLSGDAVRDGWTEWAVPYRYTPIYIQGVNMKVSLLGKVALVTGASRGVGKGIALGLGEAGAVVYITGRTVKEGEAFSKLPGTVFQTAEEVNRLGGVGIAVPCDHRNDAEVRVLFERIRSEQGRLDILVNNVWAGYEHFSDGTEFWKEKGFWDMPIERWDKMFQAGVRAHFVASAQAAPLMIAQKSGLIVNTSFFAAQRVDRGVAYSVAKKADDHMAACMAHELRAYNVAVVSLYPGLVRTESVMANAQFFDMSNSESPQFIGRAVAALAADPKVMEKTGKVLVAAQLALEYGFTDIDGKQPRPINVDEA